ncbi:hypothetical protein F991_01589, partial [Acinetobacter sp. CIP-A165]
MQAVDCVHGGTRHLEMNADEVTTDFLVHGG